MVSAEILFGTAGGLGAFFLCVVLVQYILDDDAQIVGPRRRIDAPTRIRNPAYSTGPLEQESERVRLAVMRECLEFRTISVPTQREGDVEEGGNIVDAINKNKNNHDDDDYDDDDDDDDDEEEGDTAGKRKKKKKGNDANASDEDSGRISLIAKILENNNSISSTVRSMVLGILNRRDPTTDEDPPLSPHGAAEEHVSLDLVLLSIRGEGGVVHHRDSCSICLEPFRVGDKVARVKPREDGREQACGNWFKEDCILRWVENNDDCPLCRVKIVQDSNSSSSYGGAPVL
mmetsp:Transcript_20921/g.49566  ORF Transcript_20921/g.49566 Transcript_20921/m.49566 type:complete len:288 (+) Transcript_20921:76-939(+)